MADIVIHIEITGQNASVTQQAKPSAGPDRVTFTSNRPDTMIRFPNASIFSKGDKEFVVGETSKPFPVDTAKKIEKFHFECGRKDQKGGFVLWGGGGGVGEGPVTGP